MSQLQALLPQLRARIAQGHGKRALNEQNTKASLIDPVLRTLGWDTENVYEVAREFKPRRADKPVDYALLSQGSPRLFIEAKALGQNLDDRKWAGQIMGYAGVAGVEWVVLTNGDEWRIYNAHAAVAVDEKLFRSVRISTDDLVAQETLALLAKAEWDVNQLEDLWKQQFVDRRVRVAVDEMFGAEPDIWLLKAIRRRCSELSPKDIRASLGRVIILLDYPQASIIQKGNGDKKPTAPRAKKAPIGTSGITQIDLIEAGIISTAIKLESSYKGHSLEATLNTTGQVIFGGVSFESLSAAAGRARQIVLGSPKLPSTNGWTFWRYRDQRGNLVYIDELRQQFLKIRK